MEKCDCTDVDTCCGSFRLEMLKKKGGGGGQIQQNRCPYRVNTAVRKSRQMVLHCHFFPPNNINRFGTDDYRLDLRAVLPPCPK